MSDDALEYRVYEGLSGAADGLNLLKMMKLDMKGYEKEFKKGWPDACYWWKDPFAATCDLYSAEKSVPAGQGQESREYELAQEFVDIFGVLYQQGRLKRMLGDTPFSNIVKTLGGVLNYKERKAIQSNSKNNSTVDNKPQEK